MGQLFDRACVLIAGKSPPDNYVQVVPDALKIQGLRVDFSIEKDNKPPPNHCVVQIYNLNEQHRGELDQKGIRVILQAGYFGSVSQIFSGDARFINHAKTGPDWITKIECGDAERAYSYARVSESFGKDSSVQDVIKSVVGALQIDPGNALKKAKNLTRSFVNGYVAHGLASAELTRILEPENLTWSIQDGRIQVLDLLETVPDSGDVPLISAQTGMVGSPEFGTGEKLKGPATLKVKTLIQPRIFPGAKFQVKSRGQNGFFKCIKVKFDGSTFGSNWYADIEAVHV